MTEMEFIKQAKEYGYSDKEIQGLLNLQKETMIPFDMIFLIEHTVYPKHTVN